MCFFLIDVKSFWVANSWWGKKKVEKLAPYPPSVENRRCIAILYILSMSFHTKVQITFSLLHMANRKQAQFYCYVTPKPSINSLLVDVTVTAHDK